MLDSLLAERCGELAAQAFVFLPEFADSTGGLFESLSQRRIRGPLDRRNGRTAGGSGLFAEALDLGSEVGLAVEPGARDSGCLGD